MIDEVRAEYGVRQLHARYADAVWRKDAAAFAACFTPDGEWRIAGMVLKGREQLAATITGILADAKGVLMTFRTPLISIAGEELTARTYVTEQCGWHGRAPVTTIGRYYDRFVEADGAFLFAWRAFQTLYIGPADLSGGWFDEPDFGPPPAMPPLDVIPAARGTA